MEEKTVVLGFERVRQDYSVLDARGIPVSVHARYRNSLAEMSFKVREMRKCKTGKKLGELLVETGVLDQKKLQQALAEQKRGNTGELLGEVLLSLGLIKEETFTRLCRPKHSSQW